MLLDRSNLMTILKYLIVPVENLMPLIELLQRQISVISLIRVQKEIQSLTVRIKIGSGSLVSIMFGWLFDSDSRSILVS